MDLKIEAIHNKAVNLAAKFHRSESDVLDVLQEVDDNKVFIHMGFSSLFDYAVKALKLSEANASNFIAVARKSKIIPELKEAIRSQEITISKARKITPVITKENSSHWLELAKTLPRPKLEREVAKINPQTLTPERAKYVTENRLELKLGVSEEIMEKLKRVQDLISQKSRKAASFEDTLGEVLSEYIARHDPVEKAKRNFKSDARASPSQVRPVHTGPLQLRSPLNAQLKHKIQIRDNGQCAHKNQKGERCDQKRWLDLHHVLPIAKGGSNDSDNLKTLCHNHHKQMHLMI